MSLKPHVNIETVRRSGGGTFDNTLNPVPRYVLNTGYLVGTHSVLIAYSLDDAWRELEYHFWPYEYRDLYLGFWHNVGTNDEPGDNYWYVDFVIHTQNREYAESIARLKGEIAIFDLKNQETINV